jgi:transposase
MSAPRKTYRPWDPDAYRHQAHAPATQLPDDDLVFFLLDVVPELDLTAVYAPYEDQLRGAPPFDPRMMTCLLLYAYSVGVFSSRKIAAACERNLAFLAIVGDDRPDFRTVSDFRKVHLNALADLFTQVLALARAAGLVQLGLWATDGSKFPGNASRHKAMSYGYLLKEVERLKAEILELLTQAQHQDEAEDAALGVRRGDELPTELRFREQRLAKIQQAKARLEEQARAAAAAERQRRADAEAQRVAAGRPAPGGRPAQPVEDTPDAKAQTNFTDPELKVMPQPNKGWEYSGNAQVVVDDACQVIVACDVVTDTNDKRQAVPLARQALANLAAARIDRPATATGAARPIVAAADSGYFSADAVAGLEALGLDPYLAVERAKHHAAAGPAAAAAAAPVSAAERMRAKVRTAHGRAVYGLRKGVVEPVFGQIKGARGFRRFALRGLAKIKAEWRLVCLTHNLLKLWRYGCAPSVN